MTATNDGGQLHAHPATPIITIGSRLTVAIVAGILGILVVGQLRGQAGGPGLSILTAAELTQLIANLTTGNDQLRDEISALSAQQSGLAAAKDRGETTVDELQGDLERIQLWAGLTPVAGEGIAITVDGAIGGDGIEDLLNELRNAGAEALSVDSVRIVPGVVVTGQPGALAIGDHSLPGTFEVRAIGSPQILTGTLTRIGGVIAQVGAAYPDARLTVTPVDRVTLPATDRPTTPSYAKPRL
jgi:uncharacterized protein YlxW (UPF0749 family)